MIRFLLPLFVFLVFIGESIFVDLFSPESLNSSRDFVPRFVMVMLIFIGTYLGRAHAIYYGICFGLLFDIMYIDIIGIYLFLFPLISYIMAYIVKVLHLNLFVLFFIALLGVAVLEILAFGIYKLIGVNEILWDIFLEDRLFPSLVLNGVFVILIFFPMRKLLIKLADQHQLEN